MKLIEGMYAFLVQDPEQGIEGLAAFKIPGEEIWMPMVAADKERLESLREHAEAVAKATGHIIKVCRFSKREDIDQIGDIN